MQTDRLRCLPFPQSSVLDLPRLPRTLSSVTVSRGSGTRDTTRIGHRTIPVPSPPERNRLSPPTTRGRHDRAPGSCRTLAPRPRPRPVGPCLYRGLGRGVHACASHPLTQLMMMDTFFSLAMLMKRVVCADPASFMQGRPWCTHVGRGRHCCPPVGRPPPVHPRTRRGEPTPADRTDGGEYRGRGVSLRLVLDLPSLGLPGPAGAGLVLWD